jgi:hypothetical protein
MLIRLVFHTLEIQAVNGNVVIVAGSGKGEIMKKELEKHGSTEHAL